MNPKHPKPASHAKPKGFGFPKGMRLKKEASPTTPAAGAEVPEKATTGGSYKSPVIEAKSLELDHQCAYINQILKAQRKQNKALHVYSETGQDLIQAFNSCAANSEEDLAAIMDISARVEKGWLDSLRDLEKDGLQFEDDFEKWLRHDVAPSRQQRKQFDAHRSAMDKAAKAHARADPLNVQKFKEAEEAKEKQESLYNLQGENTYYAVSDTLVNTKMTSALAMIEHFNNYYKFFSNGLALLEAERAKVLEIQARVLEDQQKFHQEMKLSLSSRPRGLWNPEGGEAQVNVTQIFHVNYAEVVARENPEGQILPFLDYALSYLEQPAILETQGLFRLSANKPQLDALRSKIDKGNQEFTPEELEDVHMVTGIIKLFLRSLPEPLLTFDLYTGWVEAADREHLEQKVADLKVCVQKLPDANRVLLQRLMFLCTKVLAYSSQNLMTVQNLAIVLGPSVLYNRNDDELTMVQSIQKSNSVIVLLVSNYAEIFKGFTFHESNFFPKSSLPPSLGGTGGGGPPTDLPPTLGVTAPPKEHFNTSNTSETLSASGKALPVIGRTGFTRNQPSRASQDEGSSEGGLHNHSNKPLLPPKGSAGSGSGDYGLQPPPGYTPPALAGQGQVATTGDNEQVVPTKYSETGEIIPSLVALTPKAFATLVGSLAQSKSYYTQLYELFTSAFAFIRAAHNLVSFTQDEIALLNSAFQNVARAIRNMLAMIKEYTQKFPQEVARRILQCAHEVRPHIKSLITCVKEYNTKVGIKTDKSAFMDSSKNFLIAVYQMYIVTSRASQMDALCQTGFACGDFIDKLGEDLTTSATASVMSLSINNLQNATLEFTSLLRARVQDIFDQSIQSQLSVVVEATELYISEIFDEARNIIQSNVIAPTPLIEQKLATLSKIIKTTVALHPVISVAVQEANVSDMMVLTAEQFQSVIEMHSGEQGTMQAFLNELQSILTVLETMGQFFKEGSGSSPTTQSLEWLNACNSIVSSMNNLIELVTKVATIPDESLASTLRAYAESVRHFLIQFEILGSSMVWDIRIQGYEDVKCLSPLKDFAFITFPFSYNFRDAATEYDSNQDP